MLHDGAASHWPLGAGAEHGRAVYSFLVWLSPCPVSLAGRVACGRPSNQSKQSRHPRQFVSEGKDGKHTYWGSIRLTALNVPPGFTPNRPLKLKRGLKPQRFSEPEPQVLPGRSTGSIQASRACGC